MQLPIKLTELKPVFIGHCAPGMKGFQRLPDVWGAQGILFLCPACTKVEDGVLIDHSILIWFENAEGVAPAPTDATPIPRWHREGKTFDTLTLSPSVNASCWHGWIKNGTVT